MLLVLAVGLAGCFRNSDRWVLSEKAKGLWEQGQYADAARHFITLAELYPRDPIAEESLFWAASLFQHFVPDREEAIRYFQQLLVQFPDGTYAGEARESLAALYEQDKTSRHRALQIYQQLLLSEGQQERHDYFQFKIASLDLNMGILDQARFEFRNLITRFPNSAYLPEAYYLVAYSYFLEKRYGPAVVALHQIEKDFPGTRMAHRAGFFMGEILEEEGKYRNALTEFRKLEGKYHNPKILEKRIASLRARIRRGVR